MYPQKLIDYLVEQEQEGNEIITTHTDLGVMWLIPQQGLGKWIILVEWYEGSDEFQLINLTGRSFDRLRITMDELK